jgi:hypothetical protein
MQPETGVNPELWKQFVEWRMTHEHALLVAYSCGWKEGPALNRLISAERKAAIETSKASDE